MVTDAQTHAKSECITQPSGSLIHIWIRQHWNYGGARYRLVRDHPVPPPPLCKSNRTGLDLRATIRHQSLLTLASRGVRLGLLIISSMPARCFWPKTEESSRRARVPQRALAANI